MTAADCRSPSAMWERAEPITEALRLLLLVHSGQEISEGGRYSSRRRSERPDPAFRADRGDEVFLGREYWESPVAIDELLGWSISSGVAYGKGRTGVPR